ncbi:MAG: non-canonical purine NTP pyrophosphatase [Minisyncoccia bacterium]
MKEVTFVTGNVHKAEYLAKYLGVPVSHQKIDLDEIQSLSVRDIVEHKVRQAYDILQSPVLVEDVSLEYDALGGLPGPFIRFFLEQMPLEKLCTLVGNDARTATARCVMGYYDGTTLRLFEGSMQGTIARIPEGAHGYGWDRIFIPEGYTATRASLGEKDDRDTYLRIKPFEALKNFLKE